MIAATTQLIRPRVSLAVATGSLFGALYHGSGLGDGITAAIGAFLLCAACSALNQIQERERDSRMLRTRNRPLASGRMEPRAAWRIAGTLGGVGLSLFGLAGGLSLFLLGVAILVVYNGVYTPLKPLTPLALLAGGFAGAVPPLTGWMAAGGALQDPRILGVTVIFYLWQVPHFWLLAEKHRRDYERAGFAMLHASLSSRFRSGMMGVWVAAYFIGLACLSWLDGHSSLQWLVPPAMLFGGGVVVALTVTDRWRPASVAMYASLPIGLAPILIH